MSKNDEMATEILSPNRKLSKKKADALDFVVEKKQPAKDHPANGSNQHPKKRPRENQNSSKTKKVKPNEPLNDADKKRVTAAIEAVTTTYGVGVDMQTKLAAAVLRGVTCRPSGKCKWLLLHSMLSS